MADKQERPPWMQAYISKHEPRPKPEEIVGKIVGAIVVAILFVAFWVFIGIPLISAGFECNFWAC